MWVPHSGLAEATTVLGVAHDEWGDDFRRLAATVAG